MQDQNEGTTRVAHLIHTMAYGGVETTVLNWLRTIDRRRFEVHLFCFANPGATEAPFVKAAADCGLAVVRIPWHRGKPVFRAARDMAAHIRAKQIEILHCHNTYAQMVTLAAGRMTGVKTITTFYVWGDFGWKRKLMQWVDSRSARLLDQVSAHCERTVAETVRRGIPVDRVRLLPSGFAAEPCTLAPEERSRRRLEFGADDRDIVLINVARFWPEKAHDVLLEAFRIVVAQRPDTVLWLAGSGPEEGGIHALAERLRVSKRTRFLGFRRDVSELLALADIQVHPSDMEGVPLAVCEGMAAGLPVVATAVGGLTEILRDGRSGILVPSRRPYHLAEAILDLIDQPQRRNEIGAAARRYIEDEYSLKAATARLEAVYEKMLAR